MSKSRPPLYERLKTALEQGSSDLQHDSAKTWQVESPEPAPTLASPRIRELRNSLSMPQAAFAAVLNVSVKTVQAWEQGLRKPDGATLRLLQILSEHPSVMDAVPAMKYSRRLVHKGKAQRREAAAGSRRGRKVA